jgi:shikimate kinase
MTDPHARPVALVGLSGAGKSTLAPRLAARLGGSALDLDARLEAATGTTVGALFAARGEPELRRLELAELERAVQGGSAVIACGGGVIETPEARALLLRACRVVWLEVAPDEALARLGDAADRPLLAADPRRRLGELLARRAAWYAEVATVRVATAGRTPDAVADAVVEALAGAANDANAATAGNDRDERNEREDT